MDELTPERRSANMRAIRSKNTKPEMIVRRLAHALGYRFQLHRRDLPGSPDLVFPGRKKVLFVNGCFWHQHSSPNCREGRAPRSNSAYWQPKLARNAERDAAALGELTKLGWKVETIWECELRSGAPLAQRLEKFLGPRIQRPTKP